MLVNYPTNASNTPSIQSGTIAIAANSKRLGWSIQNCGTATLYVLMGNGASTAIFHYALKGGTANDDGNGGLFVQTEGVVYTGIVTVNGTGPALRYVVGEIAP